MTRRDIQALMGDPLLNVREAAGILKVCERTVREHCRIGRLSSAKLGYRTVRIRKSAVEKFIAERTTEDIKP
jgi:excisionase family DNA binding protein